MRALVLFTALSILAVVHPSEGGEKRSKIAGWDVSVEKDPFGSDDRVIAIKMGRGAAIAFRCFSHKPQIAIFTGTAFRPGDFSEGKLYEVKLRVDEQPIQDAYAIALSNSLIQVETATKDIYGQLSTGKELALKVSDDSTSSQYSVSLRGSTKGLAEFRKSCNIEP